MLHMLACIAVIAIACHIFRNTLEWLFVAAATLFVYVAAGMLFIVLPLYGLWWLACL